MVNGEHGSSTAGTTIRTRVYYHDTALHHVQSQTQKTRSTSYKYQPHNTPNTTKLHSPVAPSFPQTSPAEWRQRPYLKSNIIRAASGVARASSGSPPAMGSHQSNSVRALHELVRLKMLDKVSQQQPCLSSGDVQDLCDAIGERRDARRCESRVGGPRACAHTAGLDWRFEARVHAPRSHRPKQRPPATRQRPTATAVAAAHNWQLPHGPLSTHACHQRLTNPQPPHPQRADRIPLDDLGIDQASAEAYSFGEGEGPMTRAQRTRLAELQARCASQQLLQRGCACANCPCMQPN